ncbi:MAG: tyrosine-type recombinase/integrase [Candidatus Sumerlaeia bacterium]|nr:tyrosine-type recombinase/integrase [Candidatus Sumerlaeia bacterium]
MNSDEAPQESLPAAIPQTESSLRIVQRAREYAGESRAANTKRAYKTDWRLFVSWCDQAGRASLPSDGPTLAIYITDLAERGVSIATIERRLATISQAHKTAGQETPTKSQIVRDVLKGIRRTKGTMPKRKKAVGVAELRGLVSTCDNSPKGRRDRALLLVGFLGGFRRSELAALCVGDVHIEEEGLRILIRKSKTDADGHGREVGIPMGNKAETCPVLALAAYLNSARITDGPIFQSFRRGGTPTGKALSGNAVASIIKDRASLTGLDPEVFSGHSLRSGFCTAAARAGASEREIARSTGHRSLRILRTYIQAGTVFAENAAKRIVL